jgi:hypothetical protein
MGEFKMETAEMTAATERLVRLMVMLPDDRRHPFWDSLIADAGSADEVLSMRWFVGDTTYKWRQKAPRDLAKAVLTVLGRAKEATLTLISGAVLGSSGQGPGPGAAWVAAASAAALEILAAERPFDEVLEAARERWDLPAEAH